jgi:hypothetical protein
MSRSFLLFVLCAYLFDVFIEIPRALSFPGLFARRGGDVGGVKTTA